MDASRPPRSRRITRQPQAPDPHPIGTPNPGVNTNTGPLATAAWLLALDLRPTASKWFVEVQLRADDATELRLELFADEWGFVVRRDGKTSWIRVTDLRFVHGQDDFALLPEAPALRDLRVLVRNIEQRFGVELARHDATIRTNLHDAEPAIRRWITSL